MFVEIDTLEKAKPLSEAGLLWFMFPKCYKYQTQPEPDQHGYWTDAFVGRDRRLWDQERADGCRYYILLEE